MIRFTKLVQDLDQTTSNNRKVEILTQYFLQPEGDKSKLWAIALFTGKRPSRIVNTSLIRSWCAEVANIPLWLFEQNYHIIGDLAETISLVLPLHASRLETKLDEMIDQMQSTKNLSEPLKKDFIISMWKSMDKDQVWVFNKLITGGFRLGVSKNLIIQALSNSVGTDVNHIAYLLMGKWTPETISWSYFTDDTEAKSDLSKPFPFYLAHALPPKELENIHPDEWAAEWKWDGIRCQLIHRKGSCFLWSRGEELMTDKFPELESSLSSQKKDLVIDGEIVAWKNDGPMDFQKLQTRIGRKHPGKKIMNDVPIKFIAYDILELNGKDLRNLTFSERRVILETMVQDINEEIIALSPLVYFDNVASLTLMRNEASDHFAEGLMLKRKTGIYHSGRRTGDMWKWKKDPFLIDAVLIYAQRGHGRRANLFSDFTFALRDGDKLLPFAKAYSGLTDAEISEITEYVRKNTLETFGPVKSVKAELVFELAFEGISLSTRHKSGIAVRFPRINRWRKDKSVQDIDTIEGIKKLLSQNQ